jgi:DNA-binding response OmpR family regulator
MRRLIASQLEENYAVYEYPTCAEGFEKAKEIIPDIIVIDVINSRKEGNEFCSMAKKDANTSHIPIIFLIAKATMEIPIKEGETGADDYLVKPFNKMDLLMKIKNLISARRKFREILGRETITGIKSITGSVIELTKVDKLFINSIMQVIENHYKNSDFTIEQFCNQLGMGQTQLRRKMSALFNKSPNELILRFRLHKAAKLINEEGRTGTKAAYEVGFDNLSYFSKCYRSEFGQLPSESGN